MKASAARGFLFQLLKPHALHNNGRVLCNMNPEEAEGSPCKLFNERHEREMGTQLKAHLNEP